MPRGKSVNHSASDLIPERPSLPSLREPQPIVALAVYGSRERKQFLAKGVVEPK